MTIFFWLASLSEYFLYLLQKARGKRQARGMNHDIYKKSWNKTIFECFRFQWSMQWQLRIHPIWNDRLCFYDTSIRLRIGEDQGKSGENIENINSGTNSVHLETWNKNIDWQNYLKEFPENDVFYKYWPWYQQ